MFFNLNTYGHALKLQIVVLPTTLQQSYKTETFGGVGFEDLGFEVFNFHIVFVFRMKARYFPMFNQTEECFMLEDKSRKVIFQRKCIISSLTSCKHLTHETTKSHTTFLFRNKSLNLNMLFRLFWIKRTCYQHLKISKCSKHNKIRF